jgi:hypothetical protein
MRESRADGQVHTGLEAIRARRLTAAHVSGMGTGIAITIPTLPCAPTAETRSRSREHLREPYECQERDNYQVEAPLSQHVVHHNDGYQLLAN